jgi:peptidyl-prolyl cis-trans isomerase C
MLSNIRTGLPIFALFMVCGLLQAQPPEPIPIPPPKLPPAPERTKVAATVNGKPILEIAVYRALSRVPPANWEQARPEVLEFLVENVLVDQYLEQLKFPVEDKEVQDKLKQIQEEIKNQGQEFKQFLEKLYLTEAELKEQIVGAIRWDKFMEKYAGEPVLKDLFTKNKNWFDGTLVRARHVLIKPKENTPQAAEDAKQKALGLKKEIESAVAAQVAKLPGGTDKLTIEKERTKALDEIFGAYAKKESACPSKENGGELGYFPRLGKMVEPFARAAFSLEEFHLSDPVGTEFGFHLILPTERKAGKEVTFEQVKLFVTEVQAERLREAILEKMRPISKVVVNNGK